LNLIKIQLPAQVPIFNFHGYLYQVLRLEASDIADCGKCLCRCFPSVQGNICPAYWRI